MSTILKALRRLEHERSSERDSAVNPLGQGAWGSEAAPKRGPLKTLMLVASGVVLAAVVGAGGTLALLYATSDEGAGRVDPVTQAASPGASTTQATVATQLPVAGNPQSLDPAGGVSPKQDGGAMTSQAPALGVERSRDADVMVANREGLAAVPIRHREIAADSAEASSRPSEFAAREEHRQFRLDSEGHMTIDAREILAESSRTRLSPRVARETVASAAPRNAPDEDRADAVDEVLVLRTHPATSPTAAPKRTEITVARTVWHPVASRRRAILEIKESDGPREVELREGERIGSFMISEIRPAGVTAVRNGIAGDYRVGGRL